MNLVYYEHPAGETTNDQRQLSYIYDFEQPPPLNTMFETLLDVFSGKVSSDIAQTQFLTLLLLLVSNLYLLNLSKLSLLKSSPQKTIKWQNMFCWNNFLSE